MTRPSVGCALAFLVVGCQAAKPAPPVAQLVPKNDPRSVAALTERFAAQRADVANPREDRYVPPSEPPRPMPSRASTDSLIPTEPMVVEPSRDLLDRPSTAQPPEIKSAPPEPPAVVARSVEKPVDTSETVGTRILNRAKDNPRDILAQLEAGLYTVVAEGTSPQAWNVALLPDKQREAVAAITEGLELFRLDCLNNPTNPDSRKLAALIGMGRRLELLGDLNVPTIVACQKVIRFGEYMPMDAMRLPAGRENETLIYVEIENLLSKLDPTTNMWSTQVSLKATLYTETGTEVWDDKPPKALDQCHSRRRDFYLVDRIRLPRTLPAGRYTLKVTVEDLNEDRVAENTMPVALLGPSDNIKDSNPFGGSKGPTISGYEPNAR